MAEVQVAGPELPRVQTYPAPCCTVSGPIQARHFQPSEMSIWRIEAELSDGASFVWGPEHGDEVLFVLQGELQHEGVSVPEGGAAVIESGVATAITALG